MLMEKATGFELVVMVELGYMMVVVELGGGDMSEQIW